MGEYSRRGRRVLACGLLSWAGVVAGGGPAGAAGSDDGPVADPHAQHGAGPTVEVRPHGKAGSDVFAVTVRRVGADEKASSARSGERVSYEIVVRNRTAQDFPGAEVVQMLPGGTKVVSSAPGGFVDQEWLVWQPGLDAKESMTLRSTVVVPKSDDADAPRSRTAVCVRVETAAGFSGCGAVARPAEKQDASAQGAPGAPAAEGAHGGGAEGDGAEGDGKHAAEEGVPRVAAGSEEAGGYEGLLIGGGLAAALGAAVAWVVRVRRRGPARG